MDHVVKLDKEKVAQNYEGIRESKMKKGMQWNLKEYVVIFTLIFK